MARTRWRARIYSAGWLTLGPRWRRNRRFTAPRRSSPKRSRTGGYAPRWTPRWSLSNPHAPVRRTCRPRPRRPSRGGAATRTNRYSRRGALSTFKRKRRERRRIAPRRTSLARGRSRIRSPPRCAPHVATRSSRVFREARPRGSRTARTSTRRTRRGFPPSSRLFATSAAAAPSPSRTFSRSVWKHTRRIQPPGTTSRRSGAYCWRRPRSSRVNEPPRSSRL